MSARQKRLFLRPNIIAQTQKAFRKAKYSQSGNIQINDKAIINMNGFNITAAEDGGPYMVVPLENLVTKPDEGVSSGSANALTSKIERLQAEISMARVQATSNYSAIESAIDSSTDLRSQFALGSGTLTDLNFSEESAYLARRQIQHDIATAILAQANLGQTHLISLLTQ